ncbi:RNA-binding cell elongation regulator Jag/EloR [Ruminococcus sp.]|uniref:RNA-binding cell elongation regulator Jag/EloR n=1 Tax=Ruminococcus sp. TaxID=41978 RepID=UPI0025E4AA01|nr:RNA-binding cell elongation regulator Jag/EloR [Ruminococcus sp.]MBQ6251613.1 protein jag [Ruminococcus sp.]
MTEIFTARSVEEAKELAAKKFGKKISEIRFEIIDEGKKGLFGLGAKEAKVKATVETASSAASTAPKAETKPVTTAPAPKTEEPVTKAPVAEKPIVTTETKAAAEAVEKKAEEAPAETNAAEDMEEEAYSLDNFTLIEDEALINPKVKLAKDYITSILRAMDVDAEFTVYQNETGAVINIESNNNGTIIGRRGETLDAIQYLCSIIANKGDKDYYRITIDCLGYRSKRKETLEQLAAKVAKSVLRTGRSQPLEPMNPYERRVIHSAISNIEGVSSRSVGEEPYRKIIISSNNPRSGGRRRDDRRGGGRRNDRRNNGGERRNRDREVNMERRSVDLSTSFEKDYKRPKPEDSIEGGLYGKIEL